METAPQRVNRTLPEEQQREEIQGWPQTAKLHTALEDRTHQHLLGQLRRVLVRHEHLLTVYLAFFHLASVWITLRKCF
jgi:hypothetical protein